MNCTPIGSPSSLQCIGTDVAGWPGDVDERRERRQEPSGVRRRDTGRRPCPPRSTRSGPAAARASASRRRRRRPRTRRSARASCCSRMIATRMPAVLGVARASSASMRLIGSSSERSSTPAVAGPTCQMRMKCTISSSVSPRRRRLDDVVAELGEQLGARAAAAAHAGSTGTCDRRRRRHRDAQPSRLDVRLREERPRPACGAT